MKNPIASAPASRRAKTVSFKPNFGGGGEECVRRVRQAF